MMWQWNDGSDYLMHHGIKGQKWGIRRFQNPDGSYTAAGKERYKKDIGNKYNSGKVIKNDRQWEASIFKTINTPKILKNISNSVANSSIKELSDEFNKSENKLIELEYKGSKDYEKNTGHEWTGDGAEFHNYLIKKSSEYKAANSEYDRKKEALIKEIKAASDNGEFDNITYLKNLPNYVEVYKDSKWAKVGDTKAAAIGYCLSNMFPYEFIENREWSRRNGVGNKID